MDSDKPEIPPRPKTGVPSVSLNLPMPLEDNDALNDKSLVSMSEGYKEGSEQNSFKEDQEDSSIGKGTPIGVNVLISQPVYQGNITTMDPVIPKRPERKKSSGSKVSISSNKDNNLESTETESNVIGVSPSPDLETSISAIDGKELQKSSDTKHDLPKIPQRPSKATFKTGPDMIGKPGCESKDPKSKCSTTGISSNANDTKINDIRENEIIELSSPKVEPQEITEAKKNEEGAGSVAKEFESPTHDVIDLPKGTFPDDREIPTDLEVARLNDKEITDREIIEKENDDEKDKLDEGSDTNKLPEVAMVDDEAVTDIANTKEEKNDTEDKPDEASDTFKLPDVGGVPRDVSVTPTSNAPSIPQRPRPKNVKSSKEQNEYEKPQPTNKPKAPPKPKNLSSKIAAFQEMLYQGTAIAPSSNKSATIPKKDDAVVESSSGPSRLSSDRMKFAQSLQGLVGKGMPPELLCSGPTENLVSSDDGTEMKTEKVTHITKSRGPKKKRLPSSLKNPAVLEAKTGFNITTSQLWVLDYKPHIDAEVDLLTDYEKEGGVPREVAKEEVTKEYVGEEEVQQLAHASEVFASDEQVCGDLVHSDDKKELPQSENKRRSASGEYDVKSPTCVGVVPDTRAGFPGDAIDPGMGKDTLPTNAVGNFEHISSSGAKTEDSENLTTASSSIMHKNDSATSLLDSYVDSPLG